MTTWSNSDVESENQNKQNSDTSMLSEGSENLTDYSSETSSIKKVRFHLKRKILTQSTLNILDQKVQ